MDSITGLAAVGIAASGLSGFLVSRDWLACRERRNRARAMIAEEAPGKVPRWAVRWLSGGVAPLMPLAESLVRRRAVGRYAAEACALAEARGVAAAPAAVVSAALGGGIALAALGWLVVGSPVFGIAAAGAALVAICGLVRTDGERRAAAMRDEVPDALRSLGVCFRAGLSLMQTLRQTGSEMKGPLGEIFLSAARVLETGGTATEALTVFRQRTDVPELAFVAVALDVQHQSGGSLAHVLEAARESVEGEIELARSLKVQTAQAKLSARIVTIMPFVLIALFSLMSPGFLSPFFESLPGMLLLGAALTMQAAGVLIVHRMLNVDGG